MKKLVYNIFQFLFCLLTMFSLFFLKTHGMSTGFFVTFCLYIFLFSFLSTKISTKLNLASVKTQQAVKAINDYYSIPNDNLKVSDVMGILVKMIIILVIYFIGYPILISSFFQNVIISGDPVSNIFIITCIVFCVMEAINKIVVTKIIEDIVDVCKKRIDESED